MAHTHRAPKQWCLTTPETVTSFENWRQNILYTLSLDANFARFLGEGVLWEKKTRNSPFRGFVNDSEDIPDNRRLTREQKVSMLDLMLGQIANYCPIISRNTIVKNSTSLDNIWQTIRLHYGFQTTGDHFIDFEPNEKPEDLYQRLMAFMEDNLLCRDMGITHHGAGIEEDEELTPTLENCVVLTWLRLIHPDLPKLVKQRYGTELRSRTLASIKPEISQALDSLCEEIQTVAEAKAMRAEISRTPKPHSVISRNRKQCPLCKEAGRPDTHFLSKCTFLPNQDRQLTGLGEEPEEEVDIDSNNEILCDKSPHVNRVRVRQSPYIDAFHDHQSVRLTIDSGATGNMIRASCARNLGVRITDSYQSAHQANAIDIPTTGLNYNRDVKKPRLDDHCLDDNELNEFENLTPAKVQSLQGWTKSLQDIPDIDMGIVKKYLLASNNPGFTSASLKKYKLSRAYEHLNAKHIHSVMFNPVEDSNTFCVVKAQCLPSQSTENRRVKWLHVILDKHTGEPYGAFCICTVGRGQACSHVGALLFLLCDLISVGETHFPDDKSCTDVLCPWSAPKVLPKLAEDIQIGNKDSSHKPTVKKIFT